MPFASSSIHRNFTNDSLEFVEEQFESLDDALFSSTFDPVVFCSSIIETSPASIPSRLQQFQDTLEYASWKLIHECTANSQQLLLSFNQDRQLKEKLVKLKENAFEIVSELDDYRTVINMQASKIDVIMYNLRGKIKCLKEMEFERRLDELKSMIGNIEDVKECYNMFSIIEKYFCDQPLYTQQRCIDLVEFYQKRLFKLSIECLKSNLVSFDRETFAWLFKIYSFNAVNIACLLNVCIFDILQKEKQCFEALDLIFDSLMTAHRNYPLIITFSMLKRIINNEIFVDFVFSALTTQYNQSNTEFLEWFEGCYSLACKYFVKENETDIQFFDKLKNVLFVKIQMTVTRRQFDDFTDFFNEIEPFLQCISNLTLSAELIPIVLYTTSVNLLWTELQLKNQKFSTFLSFPLWNVLNFHDNILIPLCDKIIEKGAIETSFKKIVWSSKSKGKTLNDYSQSTVSRINSYKPLIKSTVLWNVVFDEICNLLYLLIAAVKKFSTEMRTILVLDVENIFDCFSTENTELSSIVKCCWFGEDKMEQWIMKNINMLPKHCLLNRLNENQIVSSSFRHKIISFLNRS